MVHERTATLTPERFEELVSRQHLQLRAFIRALGANPQSVDDLAQDAFLVAFRKLKSYDEGRDIEKWLRGIARNLIRNELRKDARRRRILNDHLTVALLESSTDQPLEYERSPIAALRDCIEQLPKKSRDMIAGRYRDGWLASELGQKLDMSPDAIRQALVRIRQQLKQCVERRTEGEPS